MVTAPNSAGSKPKGLAGRGGGVRGGGRGRRARMQWERLWRYKRAKSESAASDPATNTNRYDMKDVAAYVLTLCAVALAGSLIARLPMERAVGVQFVVGWFALDLCWSPESKFVRVESGWDYTSFALPTALGVAAWWLWGDEVAFAAVQGVLAAVVASYWVYTETPRRDGLWYRGCARAVLLYGAVTALGAVAAAVAGIPFKLHPWYVAFVLNALATTRREVRWWDRALHGWTWGVLLEALARDELVFDKFFYD